MRGMGRYSLETGWRILPRMFPIRTCPVVRALPKSIQYMGDRSLLEVCSCVSSGTAEVHPGAGVVGTGDNDVRQGGFFPVCGGFQRITLPLCLPREAEKTVDAGHKCRCLVQSEFRSAEQLASDVRFRDGIGVEDRHVQSRMSECL